MTSFVDVILKLKDFLTNQSFLFGLFITAGSILLCSKFNIDFFGLNTIKGDYLIATVIISIFSGSLILIQFIQWLFPLVNMWRRKFIREYKIVKSICSLNENSRKKIYFHVFSDKRLLKHSIFEHSTQILLHEGLIETYEELDSDESWFQVPDEVWDCIQKNKRKLFPELFESGK